MTKFTGVSKRNQGNASIDTHAKSAPCIAVVTNHLDSQYMGALEVQIQNKNSSGSVRTDGATSYIAHYLSPFAGVTSYQGTQENEGHKFTQKSYGMWFIPPDIGAQVLIIFAAGGECFWIGCPLERNVNFGMPAGDATTTYNNEDPSKKLPVAEVNKKMLSGADARKIDATSIVKSANIPLAQNLYTKGLLKDEVRGITSSSARREIPSKVFGISTPGPKDFEGPGEKYGLGKTHHNRLGGSSIVLDDGDETLFRKDSADKKPPEYADRKKDEDDGNTTIPHNEMMRFKTRTGHQILMHNSEDLIYIGNARGPSWIELSSNGKIDIYAEDSISVHTENDINFRADRDINFEAGREINMKAWDTHDLPGGDINVEAVSNYHQRVGKDHKVATLGNFDMYTKKQNTIKSDDNTSILVKNTYIHSEENFEIRTCKDNKIESVKANTELTSAKENNFTAGANTNILSDGNHIETASMIHMNGPQAKTAALPKEKVRIAIESPELPVFELPKRIELPDPSSLEIPNAPEDVIESIFKRVTQHEPWYHHENLNPEFYTPELTDIRLEHTREEIDWEEKDACSSPAVLKSEWFKPVSLKPPEDAEYISTDDVFKRGS